MKNLRTVLNSTAALLATGTVANAQATTEAPDYSGISNTLDTNLSSLMEVVVSAGPAILMVIGAVSAIGLCIKIARKAS